MTKREVSFSDLSGQMGNPDGGLIPLVVTDAPDLEAPVRIEVTPDEMEKIGKAAVAAVGLETEPANEQERRARFVVPLGKLANLATVAPLPEVLANAEPAAPPKLQGQRRNHNTTKDGGPLVNWSDPENAGLPHNGRVAKKEREYVVANLEAVNERRVAAGHPPIDPGDPGDAERYGFPASESPSGDTSSE